MQTSSGDFRCRQVAFWKKHQTMLQMCSDLTKKCGARVLVSRDCCCTVCALCLTVGWVQCVITMPDGVVSPRDFVHIMDNDDSMNLSVTQGNTIIFDSYTPEPEVRRRNLRNNNVSKLNQMPNRFSNEFMVRISSVSITAVLCPSTVEHYRIVDRKTGKELTASDKRPEYIKSQQDGGAVKRKSMADDDVHNAVMSTPSSRMISPAYQEPRQKAQQPLTFGAFDHPGIPLFMSQSKQPIDADIVSSIATLSKRLKNDPPPPPLRNFDIMSFTPSSSAPLLLPRRLGYHDVAVDDAAKPFPFQHADDQAAEKLDPIFGDNTLPGASSSDNIRVAVPVSDLLRSRESDNVQTVIMSSDFVSDAIKVLQELKNTKSAATTTKT